MPVISSFHPKDCQVELGSLISGRFLRRDNRFRVQVEIQDQVQSAHLANSGRLGELLVPGRPVWLRQAAPETLPKRRTAYDLILIQWAEQLVSVDSRLPGRLVEKGLRCAQIPGLESYPVFKREVPLGASRIDFFLPADRDLPACWLEAKSVTLVEDGVAHFPDAPTRRGRRHLEELISAVEAGDRAAVIFIIQREDALSFAPHPSADPAFRQTLHQAHRMGVAVHALRCRLSLRSVQLLGPIPVLLGPD